MIKLEHESTDNVISKQYRNGCGDDRIRGDFADALGAKYNTPVQMHEKAFACAYPHNNDGKHDRFGKPHIEIVQVDAVGHAVKISTCTQNKPHAPDEPPALNPNDGKNCSE
jgi:hypothetical protein